MEKACLVLEGGGNRGTYTSGVLDAFLDCGIFINDVYGVSAGALNALSYLSKQKGRSFKINKDYVFSKKCIDYKRVLKGNALNLDYIFEEVNDKLEPFDYDTFNTNKNHYVVVATDIVSGQPYYKIINNFANDWPYIKASASLPFFSKIVELDGVKLLDGGISDPIPLYRALKDGYRKVIVVLTRDVNFKSTPYKFLGAYKAKYRKYPNLIKIMETRYELYNKTREDIASLVNAGEIIAIYPSHELSIKNLEKDRGKLESIYNLGYSDAMKMIGEIKKYLEEDVK